MKNIKIYSAFNKKTGKYYVGQTTQSLVKRIRNHYMASNFRSSKMSNIIKTTAKEDWIWKVEESNISINDADERERYYIKYYNSFEDGYNSTSGGKKEWISDSDKIFSIYHIDYGIKEGTAQQLANLIGHKIHGIYDLFYGRLKNYKGWIDAQFIEDYKEKTAVNAKYHYFVSPDGKQYYCTVGEIIPLIGRSRTTINKWIRGDVEDYTQLTDWRILNTK